MKKEKINTQMLKTTLSLPSILQVGKRLLGVLTINLFFLAGCGETEMQNTPIVSPSSIKPIPQDTKVEETKSEQSDPAEPENMIDETLPIYSYNPEGRRDPFYSILQITEERGRSLLPPLQRAGLLQLKLIGIVWGGVGYSAMLQSPDGKGYTVQTGTIVGPNQGVVKEITPRNLLVQETFTDVFGEKKVRDFVFQLHPREGLE